MLSMITTLRRLTLALLLGFLSHTASAQEFRIYTRVMLENPPAAASGVTKPTVIARSLTLFHAGKVYDYIDSIGELIVFEPAQRRFLIVNTTRDVATSVNFDELHNLLKVARNRTETYVEELESDGDEKSKLAAAQLRFQLNPDFEESWDNEDRRLTMSGRFLRYSALCAVEESSQEVVDTWLRYADAMARLNYVLHPGALFPEARIAVNASLAKHRKLPVEVELMTNADTNIHLRARHEMHWEFDSKDRSQIRAWDSLIASKASDLKSFKDYQRAVLGTQDSKKK